VKTLIVYAHHEPRSMNGAMLDLAVSTLGSSGQVQVSDLYRMGWNAAAGERDFDGRANADYFKFQVEQAKAFSEGRLAGDIREEQSKVLWADLVVFQFPLWWFSMPAVMKGWIDRVLTPGFAYGGGKLFEHGPLRGRSAMLAVTTGGMPDVFKPDGRYGDLKDMLHHIHYGMLAFCGFEVFEPFFVHAPARIAPEERTAYLGSYRHRLERLNDAPKLISFRAIQAT
jgi:NAD(P)H dehydrogenase (quinone)